MIRPLDSDDLRRRAETAVPFRHFVIGDFFDVDFALRVAESFPTFEDALRVGRSFRTVNERKKVQITDTSRFAPAVLELNSLLASPSWIGLLSEVFGMPELLADDQLCGGGMHQTGSRGRLDVHVDFNYIAERQLHRRLNAIVFFNPEWKAAWGGFLELWDRDVKRCVQSLEPRFNRCVVFETSEISFHGVTAVQCPPDRARKSFATYYYTKKPPGHWAGNAHDTIFRSRPDEVVRGRVLMPAERVWRRMRKSVDDLRWKIRARL